jgi:hypothetical protein
MGRPAPVEWPLGGAPRPVAVIVAAAATTAAATTAAATSGAALSPQLEILPVLPAWHEWRQWGRATFRQALNAKLRAVHAWLPG